MSTKTPECWASDPQARGLRIEATPERSLLLPHNHFIFAELDSGATDNDQMIPKKGRQLIRKISSVFQTERGWGFSSLKFPTRRARLLFQFHFHWKTGQNLLLLRVRDSRVAGV
jgi:hypothetical protein